MSSILYYSNEKIFVVMIKTVLVVLAVQVLLSQYVYADQKYIMKSGDEYYGNPIEETDKTVKIKEIMSGNIIEIPKDSISSRQQLFLEITTQDGYRIQGIVLERNEDVFKIRGKNNVVSVVKRSNIIDMERVDKESIEELNDRAYLGKWGDNFAMGGFGLGTPGGLNMLLAYHSDWLTFSVQGGSNGEFSGVQWGLLLNVYETDDNSFSIGLGVATGFWWERNKELDIKEYKYGGEMVPVEISDVVITDKYYYRGILISMRYGGFFIEYGSSSSSFEENIPREGSAGTLINIGYVLRFDLLE